MGRKSVAAAVRRPLKGYEVRRRRRGKRRSRALADFGASRSGRRAESGSAGPRALGPAGWLSGFGVAGGWVAAEVAVAEPVAVALEAEDFGVVDEPVDHGGGDGLVAEDLAPGGEGLVAGDDQRGALVAGADEREHQVGGVGVEGDVADLIDDEQRCPEQLA